MCGWLLPPRSRERMRLARSRCRRTPFGPSRSAPTSAKGSRPGRYTWSRSGDFLLMSAISDPCDARVFILGAQPWGSVPHSRILPRHPRSPLAGLAPSSISCQPHGLPGAVDGWKRGPNNHRRNPDATSNVRRARRGVLDRGRRRGCLIRLGLSVAGAVGQTGPRGAGAFDTDVHDIAVRDPRPGR